MTSTALARLRAKIAKLSARPGTGDAGEAPDVVVLVHEGAELAQGFALAKRELDAGRSVHLFGVGATHARSWPDWAASASALTTSELGAFQWDAQATATKDLQEAMRRWIREVCPGFGPLPSDHVLFAGACARVFQPYIVRFASARAVDVAFPGKRVLHVGQADAKTPGRLAPQSALGGRAKILGWGALGLVAGSVEATRAWVAARPSFAELARLRAGRAAGGPPPRTWVGVVPDWYRINHHLLEAFALPLAERGERLGVLLVGSLHPGRRDEADMRRWHATDGAWPGLGPLASRLPALQVEQAVMPRAPHAFARALAVGSLRGARTLAGLVRAPRRVFDGLPIDLGAHARAAATWATLDVVRATLAHAAANELVGARAIREGSDVVFVASNSPNVAPVDLTLQRAGARTAQHEHGAGGDCFSGIAFAVSSVRCVWTAPDALSAEHGTLGTMLVTGMPIRLRLPPRTSRPRRLLVVSNYAHRDTVLGGRFPLEAHQEELLETARRIAAAHPDLEIRWRPHPADDEASIQRGLAGSPGFVLSRGAPLSEDATWADLVISSMSTAIFEVLYAGVPVFVHAEPSLVDLPATGFIAPERAFVRAEEGASLVLAWLAGWRPEAPGLEPEERMKIALFGASGEPVPMASLFGAGRPPLAEGAASRAWART